MKVENPLDKLQRELGLWFKYADKGMVSVTKLYEKGKHIKEKIEDSCNGFWERENHRNLRNALEFIEGLHDPEAIKYHSKDKREIYHHRICLLT